MSFTSFSHARNWGREDSVPKIAFGKFVKETDRVLLPISVEVHHALVDGVHVGRFFTRLEEALANPEALLKGRKFIVPFRSSDQVHSEYLKACRSSGRRKLRVQFRVFRVIS